MTTNHLIVGVDIAKEEHVARAVNFRGIEIGRPISFENGREGFEKLFRWIQSLLAKKNLTSFLIGLEPTGHYWFNLTDWLTQNNHEVVLVNPLTTYRNKENRDNSQSKNDFKDALVIADAVSRDGRVLKLIRQMLEAGYMENGKKYATSNGTPQGSVVSPLFSNIYLNRFDHEMTSKGYRLTRFADDWVVLCKTQIEAAQALRDARMILESLGLTLHPEKTKITHVKWGFEFLGYKLKRGKGLSLSREKIKKQPKLNVYAYPKDKSIKQFMDTIRSRTHRRIPLTVHQLIDSINPVIRGWGNYYRKAHVVIPCLLEGDGMVDAIDAASQNGRIVMYGCIGTCHKPVDFFKIHKKRLDIFSTEPKRDIDNRHYFDKGLRCQRKVLFCFAFGSCNFDEEKIQFLVNSITR